MNIEHILQSLRREFHTVEAQTMPINETSILLAANYIHQAVQILITEHDITHLSTITGQDTGLAIELLYHFWQGQGLTLRTLLPHHHAHIATLIDLIPGVAFYEREIIEMLHVTFDGHPNPQTLLLPDDWNGEAPLRDQFSEEEK